MKEVRVEDEEEIKWHVEEYFGKLYRENRLDRLKVDGLQLPCIDTI